MEAIYGKNQMTKQTRGCATRKKLSRDVENNEDDSGAERIECGTHCCITDTSPKREKLRHSDWKRIRILSEKYLGT